MKRQKFPIAQNVQLVAQTILYETENPASAGFWLIIEFVVRGNYQ